MNDPMIIVLGAVILCDLTWRIRRIVNGESIKTALFMTTRIGFIFNLIVLSLLSGWQAWDGDIISRIICGIVSVVSATMLVLELTYGGKKPPDGPVALPPPNSLDSN